MSEEPVNKLDPSFWLSLFFMAVIAIWVVTAADFDWDTRLFPWAVGIPALVLALRQLATDWKGSRANAEPGEEVRQHGILDIQADESIPAEVVKRHTLKSLSWVAAFACGIWLVGFLISIPLFVFFYLTDEAKASKPGALLLAGLTLAFVWLVFEYFLNIAWPEAALFRLFWG